MGTFTTTAEKPQAGLGTFATKSGKVQLNDKLLQVLEKAAAVSPYNVIAFSGVAGRSGGSKNHPAGNAIDVYLQDPQTGKLLTNYSTGAFQREGSAVENFDAYEQFAQTARVVQQQQYPELSSAFRWGGYFGATKSNKSGMDLMHFDVNPTYARTPELGGAVSQGSWAGGAGPALLAKGVKSNGGLSANPQLVAQVQKGIPLTTPQTAPTPMSAYAAASAPQPSSALSAIDAASPQQSPYVAPRPGTPVPPANIPSGQSQSGLALGYADELPDITTTTQRPRTPAEAEAAARQNVAQWLKGSNVKIDNLTPAEQTALIKAIPQLQSLSNNPKAQLDFIQQNGLYDTIAKAVPMRTPSGGERAGAAFMGIDLPPTVPEDISKWGLRTGKDADKAAQAIADMMTTARSTPATDTSTVSQRANALGPGPNYQMLQNALAGQQQQQLATLGNDVGTGVGQFADLQRALAGLSSIGPTTTYTTQQMQQSNPAYLAYIAAQNADPVGAGPGSYGDLQNFLAGGAPAPANVAPPPPKTITTTTQVPVVKPSEEVRQLQTLLNGLGYSAGGVDGLFGPNTTEAVKAFQRANGLAADGIVGPQTIAALTGAQAPPPVPGMPATTVAPKQRGDSQTSNALAAPTSFTGTATGTTYNVGQQYTNSLGQTVIAQADGSFVNPATGKVSVGSSKGKASGKTASGTPLSSIPASQQWAADFM